MTRDQIRGILFGTAIGDALGGGKPDTFSMITTRALANAELLADNRSVEEFLKKRRGSKIQTILDESFNNVFIISPMLASFCLTERDAPWSLNPERLCLPYDILEQLGQMTNFALTTHASPLAAASCAAVVGATVYCLERKLDEEGFIASRLCAFTADLAYNAFQLSTLVLRDRGVKFRETDPYSLPNQLRKASRTPLADLGEAFGCGAPPFLNAVPFCLGHLFHNPSYIDPLHRVVAAGGDARCNGALVGALLGALNGMSVFPNPLVQRLAMREEIERVATKVCDALNLPNGGAR